MADPLQLLFKAREGMTGYESALFGNHFLGALSARVPEDVWLDCLQTAKALHVTCATAIDSRAWPITNHKTEGLERP